MSHENQLHPPIRTKDSFLSIYDFNDALLLEKCASSAMQQPLHDHNDRKVGFFTDTCEMDYCYGSLFIAGPQNLTQPLRDLLNKINGAFESDCNSILVNHYADASQYIPRHSDSMNHADAGVLIVSYGATRNFRVYDKSDNKICDVPLIHGKMIQMGGKFQIEFEHDIEPELINDGPPQERISFSLHKYMGLGLYE